MSDRLELTRSVTSAAILCGLAVEHGMPLAQALRGTGITPALLDDPTAEIQARQELHLVGNIVAELGHIPALGLHAGQRYRLAVHGIWAFAVVTSPSVRHAWRVGVDFMDIAFSFARWRFDEYPGHAEAVIDYTRVPADLRTFLLERDIAEMITIDKEIFGTPVRPSRVELACPPPNYPRELAGLLGIEPEFDAPTTRITLTNDILELPLPRTNPQLAMLAEAQADELLRRRRVRRGVAARVRAALLTLGVHASQDQIADELGLSVRTVRRRLDAENTSYRELVVETRRALAEELLAVGTTVEDTAVRLGYADASSFTHAFIRWTGTTPGKYARQHR